MTTTTKKELIERIAIDNNLKQMLVKNVVQTFLDEVVSEIVKGNRLEFRNFGIFETTQREARIGQNPKTLETVQVPAKRRVKFKMGRDMKRKLNGQVLIHKENR